jgi:hypothetical protein
MKDFQAYLPSLDVVAARDSWVAEIPRLPAISGNRPNLPAAAQLRGFLAREYGDWDEEYKCPQYISRLS